MAPNTSNTPVPFGETRTYYPCERFARLEEDVNPGAADTNPDAFVTGSCVESSEEIEIDVPGAACILGEKKKRPI